MKSGALKSQSDLTDLKGEYAQNQLSAVNADNDLANRKNIVG